MPGTCCVAARSAPPRCMCSSSLPLSALDPVPLLFNSSLPFQSSLSCPVHLRWSAEGPSKACLKSIDLIIFAKNTIRGPGWSFDPGIMETRKASTFSIPFPPSVPCTCIQLVVVVKPGTRKFKLFIFPGVHSTFCGDVLYGYCCTGGDGASSCV